MPRFALSVLGILLSGVAFAPSARACENPNPCPPTLSCDDGDPCTDDVCYTSSPCGCAHVLRICYSDNNPCTYDHCVAGDCVHDPLDCSRFDGPCTIGVCNQAAQDCQAQPRADGTPCDDNSPCTDPGVCEGGACSTGASAEVPEEVSPSDVRLARFGGSSRASWMPAPVGLYDVLRGRLQELPVGASGGEAGERCLALGISDTSVSDPENPSAGNGYWYLVRGSDGTCDGPWGYEAVRGTPTVPEESQPCF